ncbi:MAG TPA: efflux RND transporter periplasmic adaptor subunit [Steroidobacteraceae bacterium]|jgi:HlyD family secretion protein|nr:efflux RND transporter periplasmic adaptor subunit [Steroidobacteraceae bacterium]
MNASIEHRQSTAAPLLSRRNVWPAVAIGAVIVGVVVLLAVRLTQALGVKPVTDRNAIPTVSVTEVGVSTVPTTVSIIGTIAARYDMPIGVEGDGGRVAAIYVEAGDHVKSGQVLARLNVSVLEPQVANLEAALEQARAEAELADAEYRRAQAVGASGALSAEETQRRKSAGVTAAAKVKVAAAQLAEAQARLARAAVRAPADGIILTRNVEVGQTATAGGEALFRLSQGGEVELRGQVAEQDLPLLKVGQAVNVRLTGTSRVYEGRVRLLGAVIDPQTRLGQARVTLTPDPNLRPGAFARAEVTVSNADRAVLPQTAVLTDDKGTYVLIVNAQHKIERRTVHVSGIVQNGVTIADGIGGTDQVVATAGAFLQEGELVNPVMKEPARS